MKKSARSYQKRPEPEPAAFHRITEGLGLDGPLGASGPALLQQGHPEQGAEGHVQVASENPRGDSTASGQPAPVLCYPHSEVLPDIQTVPSV